MAVDNIIQTVYSLNSAYEEAKRPVEPTVRFKMSSMIVFALCAELFLMVAPLHIKVHPVRLMETASFSEYYCVCGCVCKCMNNLMYHMKSVHLGVWKTLIQLVSSQIDGIDFRSLIDFQRSSHLGTHDEQR
jgi:hypothetical protein